MKSIFVIAATLIQLYSYSQYQIGHSTLTFNDPSRSGGFGSGGGPGRQIQTEIYYPSYTAGENTAVATFPNFPVIVFGHGFAMGWDAYANIWQHLAPQGYILAFVRTEGGLIPAPSHGDFGDDLALVATKMLALNGAAGSPFNGKVKQKVVIMGHSMGGGATMLAAENNTSIAGIVGLAPAETNPSAVSVCGNINVPALIFSGSNDGVTPPIDNHLPMYQGLASSCKSYVSITGGAHCYFANSNFNCDFGESTSSQGISITRAQQQQKTFQILDPWLNYVLNTDCYALADFQASLTNTAGTVNQTTCAQPGINALINFDNSQMMSTPTPGDYYQWYVNGQIMLGETNDTLLIPMDFGGTFTVSVMSTNGCDTSNFITLQGGVGEVQLNFSLYPNPTNDMLHVEFQKQLLGYYEILDISGRTLTKEAVNSNQLKIDCSNLSKGSYLLKIYENGRYTTKKFSVH
jgi:pimeloyl-ACP methyl ester carboxylesterase